MRGAQLYGRPYRCNDLSIKRAITHFIARALNISPALPWPLPLAHADSLAQERVLVFGRHPRARGQAFGGGREQGGAFVAIALFTTKAYWTTTNHTTNNVADVQGSGRTAAVGFYTINEEPFLGIEITFYSHEILKCYNK
ncbi:hypothetical protein NDU88_000287 [Pleurodeles waltl]|uniref:Uncharacterized protein n=1 Tax=Pleurodeles waltl TaxID=8319 RepID=A0AAV7S6E2_PLEWA|nr:hypothetical protein NDU88_000287 [Pleurodeles waltl]